MLRRQVHLRHPRSGIRKPALVLELKWDKSAQTAINQIKEKNYTSSLADYAGEIILVGINYSKKTKRHECRIERCKVGTINHPQTTHKLTETTHKPLTNGQSAVIHLLSDGEKGIRELMGAAGYKDKRSFRLSVLNDLITNGLVVMTHPENPNHRNQRYRLTLAGRKEIE